MHYEVPSQLVNQHFDHTSIKDYPLDERADFLLKKNFPEMANPEENFAKLLAFVSDFYTDLLQLPIQMGRASARGYQYFLGDIQSKRLRFEIAEGDKG